VVCGQPLLELNYTTIHPFFEEIYHFVTLAQCATMEGRSRIIAGLE
jgi:hypothetical protein